jgi:uncharacterized membrane protein YsdA (DUF1294 family)
MKNKHTHSYHLLDILGVAGFFVILALITFVFPIIPRFIIALYFGLSVITFILYAIDKRAAQNDQWRTPEATLHAWSLFGGWPGAHLAQQILRHKSQKKSFRAVYTFTVMLNLLITGWFLSPDAPERTLAFFKTITSFIESR